ncbi:MAG: M48 family metallopeptidase [Chloroflexota bacterium]
MPDNHSQTITVDGMQLALVVERKSVKNINARLRDTTLSVSAPANVSQRVLDSVIPVLARRLVRRARARQINAEEDALVLANKIAASFPNPPQVAKVQFVTTQQSRWGSYSTKTQTIRLHAALREMPRWVLEAVVAHELAHVEHPDHSPAFWSLLRQVCPKTDEAQAFLAGVSWLSHHWPTMPPVERTLLMSMDSNDELPE